MKNKEILKKVEEIVKPQYLKNVNWPHGWPHVWGVKRAAVDLAELEGEDPFLCEFAADCHDLGRIVEEQMGHVERNLEIVERKINHAELSVEPTEKILNEIGIKGSEYDSIIEAVKVHSDLHYDGKNPIAKIVRDADKKEGFGEWAFLRTANFFLEYDFQPPQRGDILGISRLAHTLIEKVSKNSEMRSKCAKGLSFNLEWYEDLLDTKSAKILFREDYEYTKSVREYMLRG